MGSKPTKAAAVLIPSLIWSLAGAALAQEAPVPPVQPTDATVAAATAPANGVISYPAAFFANFRPTNAFDMVARVPGFSYAAGDAVRGFAGAAGNVLIDGERPSSKSVILDDVLKRIPPDTIERLDLIRGGAAGVDMQGQPVVVNVVRKTATDSTFALEGYSRWHEGHAPSATTRIEGSRRTARTTLEGTLVAQVQPGFMESGHGIVARHTGAGDLIASGPFFGRGIQNLYQANGAGEFRRATDTFRVTAGLNRTANNRGETVNLTSAGGVSSVEKFINTNSNNQAELGGDYQRRLSPGVTARLVGLWNIEHARQLSDTTGRTLSQRSEKDSTGSESILRGTLTLLHPGGLTVETGAEAAFNYLDSAISLANNGVAVVLPSANVRVEERRGEGFLTASLKPTARLSLEAGARVETSRISQTGDATREKTFTFVKPRFVASLAPRPSTQLRFRLERTVGQLKFEDFAASSDLASGIVSAGNAELEPDRAWLTELTFEQRFWGKGAIVLTGTHRAIQQVVDVVPVLGPSGVFSAPGNIGDGRRDDLKVSLTLPMDNLRIPGGQIRFNLTVRDSEVTDPVTGMKRPISLVRLSEGDFSYTQDFPAWNSSFTFETGLFGYRDRSYRIGEIQTVVDTPSVKATWLYRPRPDMIVAVAVENLWSRQRDRHRILYGATRATGVVTSYDYRSSQLPPWLSLRVRKTF